MQRANSLGKTLMLGKTEGRRRRGRQRMRWLDGIKTQCTWVWVNFRRWWRAGKPGMLQSMGLQRVGHDWATELSWFLSLKTYICMHAKSLQSCQMLWDVMDCTIPGLSVHGILLARIPDWVAMSFSRGSPGIETLSLMLPGWWVLYH